MVINNFFAPCRIRANIYYKNVSESGKRSVYLDGVPVDSSYWV